MLVTFFSPLTAFLIAKPQLFLVLKYSPLSFLGLYAGWSISHLVGWLVILAHFNAFKAAGLVHQFVAYLSILLVSCVKEMFRKKKLKRKT